MTERSASSGGGARLVRTDPRPRPSRAGTEQRGNQRGNVRSTCSCHGPVRARRSAARAAGARARLVRTDPRPRPSRKRTRSSAKAGIASYIHLVAPPREIALDDADRKREQRGRGATCAHRPATEAKSNEDQELCGGRGRSIHLTAPPRGIALALDDEGDKREKPCEF